MTVVLRDELTARQSDLYPHSVPFIVSGAQEIYRIESLHLTRGPVTNVALSGTLKHNALTRDADKSLARPTSRCILFNGKNISFYANLVIYVKLKDRKRSLSRKNDHNALWHYRNSHRALWH